MKKILTGITLLILFFLFLCFPEEVKTGAQSGLFLWYNSVVPILLPFLILSGLIIGTDSLSLFLHPFSLLFKNNSLFRPVLFYPLFLGLFCGFPMGAKTISDLLHSHSITKRQADFLLPVVNQASPMFLAGFLGIHILKKELSFADILVYLYLPPFAILFLRCFFFYIFKTLKTGKNIFFSNANTRQNKIFFGNRIAYSHNHIDKKNSMSLNLEHTIWNSFHIIVTIGIYMMLFTIITCLCTELLPKNNLLSLLTCTLEFSTGLHQLSRMTFLNPTTQKGLILALTSFGGICTIAQTASLLKDTDISIKYYLFWKCIIALGVFLFYSASSS